MGYSAILRHYHLSGGSAEVFSRLLYAIDVYPAFPVGRNETQS